ncbi:MAG: hypoxanthine phosphoribosyltransferase [Prevotellaceae bacterium]|jgi:hypoxanthine phosphoribosyltransferase|nr:hypoxanthine phosphoribosyltransferase [Prevotellaceae bacterium]
MNTIRLHDKQFKPFIFQNQINKAIDILAEQMNKELKEEPLPLFLCVLNGAFMFTADLVRKMDFELELSFIKLSSYCGTQSTGEVSEIIGLNASVEGRTVVVIEDIVDTGITIEKLVETLEKQHPKQIKICTLLLKPDQYKKSLHLDYVGLKIPNAFIVGYGLDYNSYGRQLPDIYVIEP